MIVVGVVQVLLRAGGHGRQHWITTGQDAGAEEAPVAGVAIRAVLVLGLVAELVQKLDGSHT